MAKSGAKRPSKAARTAKKGTTNRKVGRRAGARASDQVLTPEEFKEKLEQDCKLPDPYPRYCVSVEGLGTRKVMTGTHDGAILSSDPPLLIRLEHVCVNESIPNLRIIVSRKKP